jgi:hypothetical protein
MWILWDLPLLPQQGVMLHWKSGHKIGCKRKGRVDFALFNIPASLNPDACRQRAQSTEGCSRDDCRRMAGLISKRKGKIRPTEGFAISDWKK